MVDGSCPADSTAAVAEKTGQPRTLVYLALILTVAAGLRIAPCAEQSFNQEEAYQAVKAERLLEALKGDLPAGQPPMFTILLAGWRAMGLCRNEWLARLLPAALGVFAVFAVYLLAKPIGGNTTALVAALLMAVSPFHVYHSQELHVFVLPPLLAVLSAWALRRAIEDNRPWRWATYGLLAAATCYSEAGAFIVAASIALWGLIALRRRQDLLMGWLIATGGAAFLAIPMYQTYAGRFDAAHVDWRTAVDTVLGSLFFLKTLAFGYSGSDPLFKLAIMICCGLACAGAWRLLARNRVDGLLFVLWFTIPFATGAALVLFSGSKFVFAPLLACAVPFYVCVAAGIAGLRTAPRRYAVLLAVVSLALAPLVQYYGGQFTPTEFPHRPGAHPRLAYRAAATFIQTNWIEGDAVVHSAVSSWLPFYYYGFQGLPQYTAGVHSAYIESIRSQYPPDLKDLEFSRFFPREVQSLSVGNDRIWLVFGDRERADIRGNSMDLWRWYDSHYTERAHETFGGLEVFLFEKDGPVVVARDCDDGAQALILGSEAQPYKKWLPDDGLTQTDLESRRGALLVRFGGESDGVEEGSVMVIMENHTEREVRAGVELLASDYLLPLASLYEAEPKSDAWHIAAMYKPGDGSKSYDVAVAAGRVAHGQQASLVGAVALPPGRYDTSVYMQGDPGDLSHSRADLSVAVGCLDLLASHVRAAEPVFGWGWIETAPVAIPPSAKLNTEIRVTTRCAGEGPAWCDIGYIAFRRSQSVAGESHSAAMPWTSFVRIEPGGSTSCTIQCTIQAKVASRIDLWVYDLAPDGKAYHIFTTNTAGAS